jgi:hypothetical protein
MCTPRATDTRIGSAGGMDTDDGTVIVVGRLGRQHVL